jgi:hypothetical protein
MHPTRGTHLQAPGRQAPHAAVVALLLREAPGSPLEMSSDEGELLLRQLLRIDPSLRQVDITLLRGDGPVPKTVSVAAIIDVLQSYPRAERLVLRGLPVLF